MTIDTVLFDLDDTLHDDSRAYRAAARRVCEELAPDAARAAAMLSAYVAQANTFWHTLSIEHVNAQIHDTREQLWYDALLAIGIDDRALAAQAAARYTRYRLEELELHAGVVELLVELRRRGCKIGIVSNGFASTHHEKVDVLGLRPYVDALFLADEMRLVKPDPNVFVHACRALGSDPARTAMVGDRYDRDVIGALEVGLFTVLVDVHAIPLPEGARPPDAVVERIDAVLDVLPLDSQHEAIAPSPNRGS